jgi:hypothetical protein
MRKPLVIKTFIWYVNDLLPTRRPAYWGLVVVNSKAMIAH